MKQKYPIAYAIIIGLVGTTIFFAQYGGVPKVATPERATEATAPPVANPVVILHSFTATKDGQTALDLLKDSAQVEYQEFDFGVMVTSINGLAADDTHYWALYVNDEYATAGASETVLKVGDTMQWIYEEISQAPAQ